MKPEAQRIKIAEWCGWTDIVDSPARLDVMGCMPGEKDLGLLPLPDYLNDLNAMWSAEERLLEVENHKSYLYYLGLNSGASWHATAAQRAEALLRTIGRWEDDK